MGFFFDDYMTDMTDIWYHCDTMPRPPQTNTKQFRRELAPPELAVLLAAGRGNISIGFRELMYIYQHLYSQGYRAGESVKTIRYVTNDN